MIMIMAILLCVVSHIQKLTEEGVCDVLRHLIPWAACLWKLRQLAI